MWDLYPGQKLKLGVLVFVAGEKQGTNNKLNPHMTPGPISERRVLSPLHHPCSPKNLAAPENLIVTCIPTVGILIF